MAKKPVHKQQDVIRKDGGSASVLDSDINGMDHGQELPDDFKFVIVGAEPVSGEVVETITSGADDTRLWGFDCIALDSEGRPRVLVDQNATLQGASVILPRAVLIALLDPTHELADAETAEKLRLIEGGEPTPIGALIIAGTDQTALRHKMAASWRAAHNSGLDKKG
jgi:hypothetical protein